VTRYFAKWDNPQAALQKFNAEYAAWRAGRQPRQEELGDVTIKDLANRFLTAKANQRDVGELAAKTWTDYHRTCVQLAAIFGATRLVPDLRSEDFGLLRTALNNST
jgi:hypothetical protein